MTVRSASYLLAAATAAVSTAAEATETVFYSYDALGRLVRTESSGGANNGLVSSTTYDKAGNRSNHTVSGAAGGAGGMAASTGRGSGNPAQFSATAR